MLKILCIHGIGGHSSEDFGWKQCWINAIDKNFVGYGDHKLKYNVDFWCYDHYFKDYSEVSSIERDLIISDISNNVNNIYGWDIDGVLKYTIGMVAKWFAYKKLRQKLVDDLIFFLQGNPKDVIIGHSFGSILSFQACKSLSSNNHYFISLGSQLNNSIVKYMIGDLNVPICIRKWYHLYNPRDIVFTEPIQSGGRIEQIITEFTEDFHDPYNYLVHEKTFPMWKYIKENYNKFMWKEKLKQVFQ